jgi:hypothetical protein
MRNPIKEGDVPRTMSAERRPRRASGQPTGSAELSVRRRYLRQRRRLDTRAWATFWVSLGAVVGWLFIAAVSGLH